MAAQLLAALARARQVRELAELVGEDALSGTDRRYLAFEDRVERGCSTSGATRSAPSTTRSTGPGEALSRAAPARADDAARRRCSTRTWRRRPGG